jgi:hypothetical protein
MTSIFGVDYQQRKNVPLFDFLVRYFPKALVQVTKVCVAGNVQHNPEHAPTDIHWSRNKSTDQLNTAMRHMVDHAMGHIYEDEPPEVLAAIHQEEGTYTLAKAAWRVLAALELQVEADEERKAQEADIAKAMTAYDDNGLPVNKPTVEAVLTDVEWWARANQKPYEPYEPNKPHVR